jgi:hypothetical protein
MVTTTEQKPKVETLTWLQTQILRKDWEALNKRRLALNLRWSDIIIPGTRHHLDALEAKAADARAEAQATPTVENRADKKHGKSKSMRAKKEIK